MDLVVVGDLRNDAALDQRNPYSGQSGLQPMSIRCDPERRTGSASLSRCFTSHGWGYSSSQSRVASRMETPSELFTGGARAPAKVIHRRLRGLSHGRSSPPVNNFGRARKVGERGAPLLRTFLPWRSAASPPPSPPFRTEARETEALGRMARTFAKTDRVWDQQIGRSDPRTVKPSASR